MDCLLFSLILNLCIYSSILVSCVANQEDFKIPIFSTKTPYFWGKDIDESIQEDEGTWIDFEDKECQIVHLNLILRHGSRFPTVSWSKQIAAFGNTLKNNPETVKRFPFLQYWETPFPEEQAGLLSDLGEEEHIALGKRFGKRFSLLFDGDLENIFYGVTYKQRTQASFKSFYEGLTETVDGDGQTNVKPSINDNHLRFFDTCSKYINSVENNKTAAPEYSSFKHGQLMKLVADKIKERLGLQTLTSEEAMTIHHLCSFGLAMFDESEWCNMLDKEDLLIFEYLYDLKQYWRRGYGHSINWGMTCPFVSHLLNNLDEVIKKAERNEEFSVAHIQFAHAETIIPLYTAFGLFNDTIPLKAADFGSNSSRLFQTSKIVPMSANMGIGLYQCEASESDPEEVYVVRLFVNEEPVVIPACGKDICKFSDFVKHYEKFLDCNYSDICENKKKHDEL